MARISAPDPNAINLTRLLARLQKTLLNPDLATEQRLRASGYERRKVGTNLEYARTLLLRLEQDTAGLKIQTRKQDVQTELLAKRDVIRRLSERLLELDAIKYDSDGDSSEGEDLLAEDTPEDDIDDGHDTPPEPLSESADLPATAAVASSTVAVPASPGLAPSEFAPSSPRARHARPPSPPAVATTTSASVTGITSTKERLLTHNRTEQESLTTSLLTMAQALKTSSLAFSSSLDAETEIMSRATDGLDRNRAGLDAAQRRMGYLRTLTEGKGWWGRMLMYVWIVALMFVALFIVAFLPKLRF